LQCGESRYKTKILAGNRYQKKEKQMKKFNFTIKEITEKIDNKYAACIIIANRAKAIRENPADVDEKDRKKKATVTAVKEFLNDKIKYPPFDIEKINIGD
jgi:DNA-directed RNA polymerase omega subunit